MNPLMEALRPTPDDVQRLFADNNLTGETIARMIDQAEFRPVRDTQPIAQAAATVTPFFNVAASSSRNLNTFKSQGCTLHNPGVLPDKEHHVIVAVGVAPMGESGGAGPILEDYEKIRQGLVLNNLVLNEKSAVTELPLDDAGEMRGIAYNAYNELRTAVATPAISLGLGGGPYGRLLALTERKRFLMRGGESIRADLIRYGAGALSAATNQLRLSFYGWRLRLGS